MAMFGHRSVLLFSCLGIAGWALSFGLGSQFINLTLRAAGWTDFAIGLNTSTYYVGIALGSLLVPALVRNNGSGCAGGGMLVSGLTLAAFPWLPGPLGWFGLRLLAGLAGAVSVVPLETALAATAPPGQRSRCFAWFAVAITLGGALGMGLGLPLFEIVPAGAFYLGALPTLAASLLLWIGLPAQRYRHHHELDALPWRDHALSLGTAWSQGFLEGGMLAFLAFYLLSQGLSSETAGLMMGTTLVGAILFQVPAGWLADRVGTKTVLLGCYAITALGLIIVPFCQPGLWLAWWLFLIGACSGAFYPLGLGLLGERLPAASLAGAYAVYMALECLGSIMGPVCMGRGREWWGEQAMFVVGLGAVLLVLVVAGILRLLKPTGQKPDVHTPDSPKEAA